MIKFSKARDTDIVGIIEVMKNVGYIDFVYGGKTDVAIKKEISKSKNIYLICYEKILLKPKKVIGYFIFSDINHNLDEAKSFTSIDTNLAYHLGVGVHSNYQKKGIGKKLTKFALSKAKKEGYAGMYADVASDNIASLKLQERLGFKKIAEYSSKKRKYGVKNILFVKYF